MEANAGESVLEIMPPEQMHFSPWKILFLAYKASRFHKLLVLFLKSLRWIFAIGLFALSAVFIINGIFGKTATIYKESPTMEPILALISLIVLILILAFLEGLGVGVVAIQSAHSNIFSIELNNKYPRAQQVHSLVSGDNESSLISFHLGRQFLVTFVVFALALFVQFETMKYFPWSNTEMTITIFTTQGIVSVIVVGCLGQLAPQLIAAAFPIQFTDIPYSYSIVRTCIFIDWIGLTYFSWLEAKVFEVVFRLDKQINQKFYEETVLPSITCKEKSGNQSNQQIEERFELDESGSPLKKGFIVFRNVWSYLWSSIIILFCFVFVLPAIVSKQTAFSTTFPDVHGVVCLLIFGLFLLALWILEGTQIAIVKLAKFSDEMYKGQYPRASLHRKLIVEKQNMNSYLIGRQFLTLVIYFFLANFTRIKMDHYPGTNWNPGDFFNSVFLVSGLMGTMIVTHFGQLTPLLLANYFPIQTLSLPGLTVLIYVCRFLEFIGLGHFSWILYNIFSSTLDSHVTEILKSNQHKHEEAESETISRDEFKRLTELVRAQEERLRELQAKDEDLRTLQCVFVVIVVYIIYSMF